MDGITLSQIIEEKIEKNVFKPLSIIISSSGTEKDALEISHLKYNNHIKVYCKPISINNLLEIF